MGRAAAGVVGGAAVMAVNSCDVASAGAGNTVSGPCQSGSIRSWRGRMEGNDSVKEVTQLN